MGSFGTAVEIGNTQYLYSIFQGFHVRAFGSCQPNCTEDITKIETRRTTADFMYHGSKSKQLKTKY